MAAVGARARSKALIVVLTLKVVALSCYFGKTELWARLVQQIVFWCYPGVLKLMCSGARHIEIFERPRLENSCRRETRVAE